MAQKLPHKINGITKPYSGNGRQLGYPTANIDIDIDLKDGVYFGFAGLAGFHDGPALIFIGIPTTVGDTVRRLEVHVLDIPDADYYGQNIDIVVSEFHRSNQTFSDINELKKAMRSDEATARRWFANNSLVA